MSTSIGFCSNNVVVVVVTTMRRLEHDIAKFLQGLQLLGQVLG